MKYNTEIFDVAVKRIGTAFERREVVFSTVNNRIDFSNNSDINNLPKKTLK